MKHYFSTSVHTPCTNMIVKIDYFDLFNVAESKTEQYLQEDAVQL